MDSADCRANTCSHHALWLCCFKASAGVGDRREAVRPKLAFGDDDLLGVFVDHQIGAVRDDDDLAPTLRLPKIAPEDLVGRLVVQILVRLVDDERSVVVPVDS